MKLLRELQRDLVAAGVMVIVFLSALAFAQGVTDVASPLDPAAAQQMIDAADKGDWLLAAALALSMAIRFLRWGGTKIFKGTKFGKLLSSRRGGWGLNFGASLIGGLVTMMATGQHFSSAAVVKVLTGVVIESLSAAGLHSLAKDVTAPKEA